jgi:N-acetyl-S-(2-succino)cysteine monooxygenase
VGEDQKGQRHPMTDKRQAHFTVFLSQSGYHESGWLAQPGHDAVAASGFKSLLRSTELSERGLLDAVFIADSPSVTLFRAKYFPNVRYDPVTMLAALGQHCTRIGLFATASTTYNAPYELARRFATADHVTDGRIGWNVVTTGAASAALNFGADPHPDHDNRYARGSEFVTVVQKLWDSWAEDAVIGDQAERIWADTSRINPIGHHGEYYDVAGALPVPRPPQGHPVLAQAGSSPAGIDLAGQSADVVFTPQASIEAALQFREKIEAATVAHGRPPASVKILPGIAFVIGSTEAEATDKRRLLEESAHPDLRWRMLALNAGLNPELIDPDKPLSPELADTAEKSTFAKNIIGKALELNIPFRDVAQVVTGLPGGLEFTGTPEQMADLIETWVARGGVDGFTLQPTTIPDSLELFVNEVVPILQARGLHRTEYTGRTLRDHLGLARPELCAQ